MYKLNKKICDLVPYQPVSGSYKIRLDANESGFNLPVEIMEQIHNAIDNVDFNRYPDPNASELCGAFADYYGIDKEYVTAGNGSDELISLICSAFLMKGEKLVTVEPDFSMYRFYTGITELECISVQKNDDLTIDTDRIIDTVNREKASAVIFSNPCNPTSKALAAVEVKKLINSVDALVVLDEAYMDFWEQSLLSEVQSYDNLIILRTASKAVGAAALRLGFAVANKTISRALKAVKSPYNVNSVSQAAGAVIYKNKEYLENIKKTIVTLRIKLYNSLVEISKKYPEKLRIIDGSSNFVFIKTKLGEKIYKYMLNNSVAIRFMGDYIRITAGTQEENAEFLRLLELFLKEN